MSEQAAGEDAWLFRRTDEEQGVEGLSETFEPSEHVIGPWTTEMQHGGPVSALLARSMERVGEGRNRATRLGRITVNLLGALPLVPLRVSARVVRPGRRIELLAATAFAPGRGGEWAPIARAEAWRLATQDTSDVQHRTEPELDFEPEHRGYPEYWPRQGFAAALEWLARSHDGQRGTASLAKLRMRLALVEGEEASPLQQLVAISDCVNGIGARLDPGSFSFLNTDLTVQLHHPPRGPWFGVQAETAIGSDGVGLSHAVLHDPSGPLGRVTQTLLVERRGN